MKSLAISSILSIGMLSVVFVAPVSSVSAQPYFACNAGFTFQVKGKSARCHQPAGKKYKPLLRCGNVRVPIINRSIGFFYKKDHKGKKDFCVGTYQVAGVRQTTEHKTKCPTGYRKEVKRGKDRCSKSKSSKNIPPIRPVNK